MTPAPRIRVLRLGENAWPSPGFKCVEHCLNASAVGTLGMDLEQRFQACEGIVLFTRRLVGPGGIEVQGGGSGL